MTDIRRYWESGFPYFMTHVTHGRKPLLIDNVDLWHDALAFIKSIAEIDLIAWVILPDHLHLLLDAENIDPSNLMKRLKMKFSGSYRSRWKLKSGRVWQYRFWDHKIRDEDDYRKHIDYIHYNPVKHGLVDRPGDWKHSSFMEYYQRGYYENDWGVKEPGGFDGPYGE